MKNVLMFFMVLCASFCFAEGYNVTLTPTQKVYNSDEPVVIKVKFQTSREDELFDTYVFFKTSKDDAIYITRNSNQLDAQPLGMLPPEMKFKIENWDKPDMVKLFVCLCKPNTQDVLTTEWLVLW